MNNTPAYNPAELQTEAGVLQLFLRQFLNASMGTVQPVSVSAVSEDGQFVDVLPLIMQRDTQNKAIPVTAEDTLYKIPVMKFAGGGCFINYMPQAGDIGLLAACKFDITHFKMAKAAAEVGSLRQFNWADGFFIPLSFNSGAEGLVIANGATTITLLPESVTVNTQTVNITASTANVTAGAVNLGGEGGQGVARIGDAVAVDPNTHKGTITAGSQTVKSL